tara:strand:+ start:261 stop:605 length:345 start_codon:yes stop_codon:yes gene_type:complete
MADRIDFNENINESVQVGDELYYLIPPSVTPIKAGPGAATCVITVVGEKHIVVDSLVTGLSGSNSFFMFLKPEYNGYTNVSSLKGYYAEVRMGNSSLSKQELFVVGSEITISSK